MITKPPAGLERVCGWRAVKGPHAANKSGLRALGHRLLLLGEQKQEKSAGGIYLLDSSQDSERMHQVWATVVEIGHDCWKDQTTDFCRVGDRVLIGEFTGKFHTSPVDGKTYRFIQDLDILSATPAESQ